MSITSEASPTLYLVLSKNFCAGAAGHSVEHEISLRSYEDVVNCWAVGTRVSPVWPIKNQLLQKTYLAEKSTLILIGQVSPAHFLQTVEAEQWAIRTKWISVGFFNLVIEVEDNVTYLKISHWAQSKNIVYEAWQQEKAKIISVFYPESFIADNVDNHVLLDEDHRGYLHYISSPRHTLDGQLDASAHEYGALVASAISAGKRFWLDISKDVSGINSFIYDLVCSTQRQSEYIQTIVNINSSLSRLTSHAFSGVPPLFETEGHLWAHSLLGVGTACIAMRKIVSFAYDNVISHGFSERLAHLDAAPSLFSDLNLASLRRSDSAYFQKIAQTGWLDRDSGVVFEKRAPFIAYLSSRDGFKYKELSISAPSSVISACNSRRLSLRTLTHEISHAIVGPILYSLLPVKNGEKDELLNEYENIMSPTIPPSSWRLAIQQYLIMTMLSMRHGKEGRYSTTEEELQNTQSLYFQEVEEILVHIFDFFYFYKSDAVDYVQSIWISWEGIPKIDIKVEEYVLRTICAVLSKYPGIPPGSFESAKNLVLDELASISSTQGRNGYSEKAREYIENHLDDIQMKVAARMPIIRIATSFLLSNKLVERVNSAIPLPRHQEWPISLQATTEGNPLLFLKANSNDDLCDEEKSAWMLNFLAYNI